MSDHESRFQPFIYADYESLLSYFRREGGLFIWQRMLRFGAAKDTKEILAEAAGGPLEASHYMDTL